MSTRHSNHLIKKMFLYFLCLSLFLSIPFCKKKLPTSPDIPEVILPSIEYFNANPESINRGESSTLSWSVSNATTITIDQGIESVSAKGTTEVSPEDTTTYTLTAKNNDGQKTKSCIVEVKEPAADLKIINVEEGTAWNIYIYCPSSGFSNPNDWQMFIYMQIENIGNRTATNIMLHLQIFDRWWEEPGSILTWSGETLFINYPGDSIILGPSGQSGGWFRWTNLSLETLETLYHFLKLYQGSTPVHFWLTWNG